jgi:hypothetical protein
MSPQENEQTQLLREILKWIKFAGMKEVKSTLISVLDTDAKRLVYQKSDGTNGTVELAKLAGFGSHSKVVDMWDTWLKLSLGENIPVRGGSRFKRSFDLNDFGIEVPEVRTAENVKEEENKEVSEQKPEATK